ncbi:unnamed protein product [Amoebophrya sp. A25]|nr:unnamed protein product [Amoebophrya sp. A25]|eukprot:GSA25T00002975001.1
MAVDTGGSVRESAVRKLSDDGARAATTSTKAVPSSSSTSTGGSASSTAPSSSDEGSSSKEAGGQPSATTAGASASASESKERPSGGLRVPVEPIGMYTSQEHEEDHALWTLVQSLKPVLNPGTYVFGSLSPAEVSKIPREDTACEFKEKEGVAIVMEKEKAKKHGIKVSPFEASWIQLDTYSAVEACGLTSVFSRALTQGGVSCNIIAGFHHDHLFVAKEDTVKAMNILHGLAYFATQVLKNAHERARAQQKLELKGGAASVEGGVKPATLLQPRKRSYSGTAGEEAAPNAVNKNKTSSSTPTTMSGRNVNDTGAVPRRSSSKPLDTIPEKRSTSKSNMGATGVGGESGGDLLNRSRTRRKSVPRSWK